MKKVLIFTGVLLSFVLVGCAIPTPTEEGVLAPESAEVSEKRELILTYATDPETLDAHAMTAFETQSIQWAFRDMFTRIYTDGTVDPWLVTEWEANDDKTVWTLKVREGVTCHDGEVFDAEDVAYSLLRARDHPESGRFSYVSGVGEAVARDSHTVQVTTPDGIPDLDFPLDLGWVFAVCKDYVESLGPDAISDHPIGTGPFTFVEYQAGEFLRGERFDDYWRGPSDFEVVTMRIIPQSSVRVAALIAEEVDLIPNLTADEATTINDTGHARAVGHENFIEVFIDIDSVHPMMPDGETPNPLTDLRVRQALYMAIDIDAIVNEVMGGFATPATQFRLPSVVGYDPTIERLPYDPEGARELLAEAGYADGFELELITQTSVTPNDVLVAQAVAEMWREIGIETSVNAMPAAVANQYMQDGNARIALRASGMGTFQWDGAWDAWIKCGGRVNHMDRCWADLDEMAEEVLPIVDLEEREEAWRAIARETEERIVAIPLYAFDKIAGVANTVEWEPALAGESRAGEFSLAR